MNLKKRSLHRICQKEQVISQTTLDEDVIVPDTKADMESLILDWGEVELEESRLMGNRLLVQGRLLFHVLYHTQKSRMVDRIEGILPFEETFNVKNMSNEDEIRVEWEVEELTISMIHSRKLNVKALITMTATASGMVMEMAAVDVESGQGIETTSCMVDVAQPVVQLRDTYRVKEEVELSGNKPNIDQILWYRLEPRGIECRPLDGKLSIHGELELFCIYRGAEEHVPLQWLERSIPFSGALEIPESSDDMVPEIRIRPVYRELEARTDRDGEPRQLGIEVVLEMEIKLYREETISFLDDIYSPGADVILQSHPVTVDHLVARNASKHKMTETLKLSNGDKILQICHGDGKIKVDRIRPVPGGLDVEGTLRVDVLYVSADDRSPVRNVRGILPFAYQVEAGDTKTEESARWSYRVTAGLEQLGAMLLGNGEMEIKAVITLDSIVMEPVTIQTIENAQIVPMDPKKLDQIPGIVGYVVQKGDTLWKIAKKFYASVDNIKSINGLAEEELLPGQKLLIVKETRGIMRE